MTIVWLVVWMAIAGTDEPVRLVNETRPDIASCLRDAQHVLEQADKIEGNFQFHAKCMIEKSSDPA
jgi:hypothetical protein